MIVHIADDIKKSLYELHLGHSLPDDCCCCVFGFVIVVPFLEQDLFFICRFRRHPKAIKSAAKTVATQLTAIKIISSLASCCESPSLPDSKVALWTDNRKSLVSLFFAAVVVLFVIGLAVIKRVRFVPAVIRWMGIVGVAETVKTLSVIMLDGGKDAWDDVECGLTKKDLSVIDEVTLDDPIVGVDVFFVPDVTEDVTNKTVGNIDGTICGVFNVDAVKFDDPVDNI